MTSIKVKFRPLAIKTTEGFIYYQITHDRTVRQIPTDYRISADEWDYGSSTVIITRHGVRSGDLLSIRRMMIHDVERLARIVRIFDVGRLAYTADDIVREFISYSDRYSLSAFMSGIIIRLRGKGQIRTSETYAAALNSFRKFLGSSDSACRGNDIMLDVLDSSTMEEYEAWLRGRGVCQNTTSFYNRILRAVYNRAVDSNVIDDRKPFRHVYTGVDRTKKRALSLTMIRKIRAADLAGMIPLDYARDMFMLSFYLRGMSFVDMAFLRKDDLRHGYITYRRRKTGQVLTIAWTMEMQHIVDKYPSNPTGYLLPIITRRSDSERSMYRNAAYNINRNLKRLAVLLGLPHTLTLYCARHSWASAAQSKGIPLGVISEGMGHGSEATTRIYLASLDQSRVDRANSLILSAL